MEAAAGNRLQLVATASSDDDGERDVTDEVEWSSSDTDVADFDDEEAGRLVAVAAGEVTITAKLDSADLEATAIFAVKPPERISLSIDPAEATIDINEGASYTATAQLSNDEEEDVTTLVEWASSDPAVVEISNEEGSKGVAIVNGPGTAEITAILDDLSATGTVTVECTHLDHLGADCGTGGLGGSSFDELAITAAEGDLEAVAGNRLQLIATASSDDDGERDVTDEVEWSSSDTNVVDFDDEEPGQLVAIAVGEVTITARLDSADLETTAIFAVKPPERISLSIDPAEATIDINEGASYTATAQLSNDEEEDVTTLVEWASSDPAVVEISNEEGSKGVAIVNGPGTVEITAILDDLSATGTLTVECTYPDNQGVLRFDRIMPNVGWDAAYMPDGTQTSFYMRDFFCSTAYADYNSLMLFVGAGWCPACAHYLDLLRPQLPEIIDAGVLPVFIVTQGANYMQANSEVANRRVDLWIGPGIGIRVGDADSNPPRFFNNSPAIMVLPSAFVVRRRDMRIIADQSRSSHVLPYAEIGRDPEADWSNPAPPPPRGNCDESDEEVYEPNDVWAQAAVLEPGSFEGGICNREPDFYRINLAGRWRLTLEFSHAVGDLNVYVWNVVHDEPLLSGATRVGSDTTTDDESFEHGGQATVGVVGYQGASAPYRLTLEALPDEVLECADGIDNDEDGFTDYPADEVSCLSADDRTESDPCVGLEPVDITGREVIAGDTRGLANEFDASCRAQTGPETVFRWIVEADRALSGMRLTTEGSHFDTVVHVREGCAVPLAEELACDVDSGPGGSSILQLGPQAEDTELLIFVDGADAHLAGAFRLRIHAELAERARCDGDGAFVCGPGLACAAQAGGVDRCAVAACADARDNDEDGLVDYPNDPGCVQPGDVDEQDPQIPPACSNGVDDDGDGLEDFGGDTNCDSAADDFEGPDCSDGIDNDGDGTVDFDRNGDGRQDRNRDSDCICANDPRETRLPQCSDGCDNDGDGVIDLEDPGCQDDPNGGTEFNEPICQDEIDNDEDQWTDYPNDPGCTEPNDPSEADPELPPQCSDGVDNDGDGRVDFDRVGRGQGDSGCRSAADPDERGPCDSEIPIVAGNGRVHGDTTEATNDAMGSCSFNQAGEDLWRADVPYPAQVIIDTFGSSYDTLLYARSLCEAYTHCQPGNPLCTPEDTELACNDDNVRVQSRIEFTWSGGPFYVFVDGYGSSVGRYELHLQAVYPAGGRCGPNGPGYASCQAGTACLEDLEAGFPVCQAAP